MTLQRCPKCNEPYPAGATSCPHCDAPLVRICPTCGTRRPWSVPLCPRCSASARDAHVFTSLFTEMPRERLQGRYTVDDLITNGETGRLLSAVDRHQGDLAVAIKELSLVRLFRADERRAGIASLNRQIERWRAVQHPALPHIYEAFESDDRFYIVMERIRGLSMAQIIADGTLRATPEYVRNWGAQLCDLLRAMHHQDPPIFAPFLSPDHVMVTPHGEIKLVGLGLGRLVTPVSDAPYDGAPGYAAPELKTDFASARSDIFAVGRLLYALLIDRDLARQSGATLPLQRAVPGISGQLVKAIGRAAHRDPRRRYGSVRQLRRALWDEAYGPLEPMPDWYQGIRRSTPDESLSQGAHRLGGAGQGMEALGFTADPRFGQQPLPAPAVAKPAPKASLSIRPRHFEIDDIKAMEKRRLVLTLRNTGDVPAKGRVISHVAWLSGPAKAFTLPAGKQARVLLTLDANAVPGGRTREPQALSLETNAGVQWIGATIEVASGPQLLIASPVVDLGVLETDAPHPFELVISNGGRQPMSGSVAARVPWLRVDQGDFRCAPGHKTSVRIVCLPERLPGGPQKASDALVVDSDGGQRRVEVTAWRQRPVLELGASHMDLGTLSSDEVAERYLIVGNTGDGPLHGQVRSLVPWLQAYPREFAVEPGELAQITVTADMAGMPDGAIDMAQALRVQSDGGTEGMSLHAIVSAPRLTLADEQISFGAVTHGESAITTLGLSNEGSAPLDLTIASLVPWLSVAPTALRLQPHESRPLQLSADSNYFTHGETVRAEAALRLAQASDIRDLPAEITVVMPTLRVEPEICDFGFVDPSAIERRQVTIANDGNGRLAWSATTAAPWVELSPNEGVCPAGQSQTIDLAAYVLMLPLESESDESTLVINSDGGRAKVALRIAKAHPLIASDTPLIELGPSINRQPVSGSLRLFNHGLGLLRGTLQPGEPWLIVDRVSFECPTGRSTEIALSTDIAELPADRGDFEASLAIESNGGDLAIDVSLHCELQPEIQLPEHVELKPSPNGALEGRLVLRNEGLATGRVALQPSSPQVELSRAQADVKPGHTVRIRITAAPEIPADAAITANFGAQRWTIALLPVK